MTFNTDNAKGSDHCFIGDLGIMPGNTYLTGCIGEIVGFYRSLTDKETSYIHQYLVHVSNFGGGGVAGSEEFACATLPTTPLDFQAEV